MFCREEVSGQIRRLHGLGEKREDGKGQGSGAGVGVTIEN